jgi:hypothetical protein
MRELVDALFLFEWEHHSDETIIAYLEFLVHLNSSQQNFLLRTIEALVMRLSPRLNNQGMFSRLELIARTADLFQSRSRRPGPLF